jgi:hypothetical protein
MILRKLASLLVLSAIVLGQDQPARRGPAVDAREGRPGPWDNDVAVYRVDRGGEVKRVATFERAGVPTVTRLADGRLLAAHQHFPADFGADFDKVAVHFSADDGFTWTAPEVIALAGFPEEMRFPFDPTLVALADGRVRLYFTSVRGRRFDEAPPAIYSAIASDGVHYEFEPGQRFGVAGRIVIDCAVVLHAGVFHLFSPDNGASGPHGERPRRGVGYHAISCDGLAFDRVADVEMEAPWTWLGNAQSDGRQITFYGTGRGLSLCTSTDGVKWTASRAPEIRGGDPGAVATRDGGLLVLITTEPRPGTASERAHRR